MQIDCFGSGSSGNSFLVRTRAGTSVVIDCGVPIRLLIRNMESVGYHPRQVQALLISHEHSDHIYCLRSFRKFGIPVWATCGTARSLGLSDFQGLSHFQRFQIGDLAVTPLPISHDAAEPCGFLLEADDQAAAILTDLGAADHTLAPLLAHCDLLVIESNHDREMLRNGSYPGHLKRRVASTRGHLSNDDCCRFLRAVYRAQDRPRQIWLAHLSENNNKPELALDAAEKALSDQRHRPDILALSRAGGVISWTGVVRQPSLFSIDTWVELNV